jgi:nucleoside phosphorylase
MRFRLHRSTRAIAAAAFLASSIAWLPSAPVSATTAPACARRVLVLSAMPLELSPIARAATLDPMQTVHIDGRTFYVGRLAGNDVVLAMTGIGLVNAQQTATTAFEHFRCRFAAAIFSGVAGSRAFIGDVAIPRRWTIDNGKTWVAANATMLATAGKLQGTGRVPLSRDVPVGDAACACPGVDAATPVHLAQTPRVIVGGDGISYDTYGGHALPCLPGGGDIAGCEPCLLPNGAPQDAANFAKNAPSLADPSFVSAFLQPAQQTTTTMDAQDEETAAVALVARRYRVPFLGIRAVSDGRGDPLNLPGFPWQFFAYRQLAGNNAAAVTIAFLKARVH